MPDNCYQNSANYNWSNREKSIDCDKLWSSRKAFNFDHDFVYSPPLFSFPKKIEKKKRRMNSKNRDERSFCHRFNIFEVYLRSSGKSNDNGCFKYI